MPKLNDYLDKDSSKKKKYFMSFALGSTPIEVKPLSEKINFSENPKLAVLEFELENFTLLELIRQSKMTPRNVLDRRIKEVAKYVNSSSPAKVAENRYIINNYLNQYIFEQMMRVMNNPQVTQVNITFLLGLNRYVKDLRSLRRLQRILTKIKKVQLNSGFINKQYQEEIKESYGEVWDDFITGVENKFINKDKRGLLSGSININEEDVRDDGQLDIASFSNNKVDEIESILEKYDEKSSDTLIKDLKNIKLDKSDIKFLIDNPVFGDTDLTELIINKSYSDVIDYINNSLKLKFSLNELNENIAEQYTEDQINNELNLDTASNTVLNMSIGPDIPLLIEWNRDKTIAYYNATTYDSWYMFILIDDEDDHEYRMLVKKFPRIIDYKMLALSDDDKKKLIDDPKYTYIDKEFEQKGDRENAIYEQVKLLSTHDMLSNFAAKTPEASDDNKINEVNWITDSGEFVFGFKNNGSFWYSLIAYKTDSGQYILEIRILPKSKYESVSGVSLNDLVEEEIDKKKKFNSLNEVKDYCDKLDNLNEN